MTCTLHNDLSIYDTLVLAGVQTMECGMNSLRRKKPSSTVPPEELKRYIDDLGDGPFSDGQSPSLIEWKTRYGKQKFCSFLLFELPFKLELLTFYPLSGARCLQPLVETSGKDGLTTIECKRGGDVISDTHSNWLQIVGTNPEAMLFNLLTLPDKIIFTLFSRIVADKPALEDLQCFLEFQVPRLWASIFCELPLRHQRRKTSCPRLQFNFIGPKIYISMTQQLLPYSNEAYSIYMEVLMMMNLFT
ncbi:membrane attack complex component/perforin (MACPF) domain-containing protein [Artemisia annua]|uniref:Membrane attack complex component/perforin (MACPF) domain-containing protein n=1 Tax=Artemisia annua TaxID=35608 RepID=A0A2U1MR29_ARTAN|nr:membrane attack complex component/perforin (MACPF) domain-containing protein [Artemisia annua]